MATVLLIEGNYEFRLLLRDVLEQARYRVVSVGSSTQAIDVLHRQPVSLVITDPFVVGTKDVFLATQGLGHRAPAVFFLTSVESLRKYAVELAALGARKVFTHPLDMIAFLQEVAAAVRRPGEPGSPPSEEDVSGTRPD